MLAALNPAAGAIPFLGMAEVEIGGVLCSVFRITFTGCMGYEIHVPKQEVRQLRHCFGSISRKKTFSNSALRVTVPMLVGC